METKHIKSLFEWKAGTGEASGTLEGIASPYGAVDSYGDTVLPGAYDGTIASFLKDGWLGLDHNWADRIGFPLEVRSTQAGLFTRFGFHSDPEAQKHRTRTSERLARGLSVGLSIGYVAEREHQRSDGVRELQQIKLIEVSVVGVPAEPLAQATAVKRAAPAPPPDLVEMRRRFFDGEAKRQAALLGLAPPAPFSGPYDGFPVDLDAVAGHQEAFRECSFDELDEDVRETAERVMGAVKRALNLPNLRLRIFRPLNGRDRVEAMAAGFKNLEPAWPSWVERRGAAVGCFYPTAPDDVWARVTGDPRRLAEVVLHEARHAAQFAGGWNDDRAEQERDARAFAQRTIAEWDGSSWPVGGGIARWVGHGGDAA